MMSSTVCRIASALSSHGKGGWKNAISGRRSETMTTRGASSANRSRTMNSSRWRADESRAEAAQSIVWRLSPSWYGREPATSEPAPRR